MASKYQANDHVSPSHSHEDKSNVIAPGRKRRGGCAAHCKRFWWLYLIIIVIVILAVVLPVVFVAIPKIAQRDVNRSTLEIQSQAVNNPTGKSVDLDIVSVTKSDSKFHPDLDQFDADLYLVNTLPDIKPFGRLTFPAVKVEASNTVPVSQTMDILDMEQFIEYNKLVINSEEFSFGVRGRTGLHQSGLPKYTVNYDKTVTMKGLNKLSGFQIKSTQLLPEPLEDGSTLGGQVNIPNPSVLTIQMGTLVLDLSVDGTMIGNSTIKEVTLRPGDNLFDMTSHVDLKALVGLLAKYPDLVLPVDIIGQSVKNDAGEALPYFEAAVKQNALRANLNVKDVLSKGT